MPAPEKPGFPVDMREGVIWAYRHLLGREPNDEAAIQMHMGHSADGLREAFKGTPEYQLHAGKTGRTDMAALIAPFQPFATEPAPAGFWRDFLGVLTRCEFLPDGYVAWSGVVQGPPGSPVPPLHDVEEWAGSLRSFLEARDRLVSVELGAGWGPWLVSSVRAAERLGIRDVKVIGVEGSLGHMAYIRNHMLDNGIDPAAHTLIHGVAGASDGVAHFPKLAEPNNTYGSEAEYDGTAGAGEMEAVPSVSLNTLLADYPIVDLVHCDIQGAEFEVFRAGRQIVDARVRRVVIGTHSRRVEAELQELFSGMGWMLEEDVVCKQLQAPDGRLMLLVDGTQVWRNPRYDWKRTR